MASSEKPELLPTHNHEPLGPVPAWHRAAKGSVAVVAVASVLFGLGIVTRRTTTMTEVTGTSASLATDGFKKSAEEVLIYKRTHPSAHPVRTGRNCGDSVPALPMCLCCL